MKLKIDKKIYQIIYRYIDYFRYYGIIKSFQRLPNYLFEKVMTILFDYPMNIIFGPRLAKKIYIALFRFKSKYNLFLFEKRLWMGNKTMESVYKIRYITPSKIKYRTDQKGSPFFIESGNWDKNRIEIPIHITIKELFIKNLNYKETQQYKNMKNAMSKGKYNKSYWCRTIKEIDKYFNTLISTYNSIKNNGYKTQEELKKINKVGEYNRLDEIRVSIDRNGEYLMENAGNHRLAIANLLKLKKIPVVIVRIHYLWWKKRLM
jgi:hypothetical protein